MKPSTLDRMQKLMPRLDQYGKDSLRDLNQRLTRSFVASYPSMSMAEKKAEAQRIADQLNEQMDRMESALRWLGRDGTVSPSSDP